MNHLRFYHLTKLERADHKAKKRQNIDIIVGPSTSKVAALGDIIQPQLDFSSENQSGLEMDFYCKEEPFEVEPQNQLKITDLHAGQIAAPPVAQVTTELADKAIQCKIETTSTKSKSQLYASLLDTTPEKIDIMLEIYGSYDKILQKLEHRLNK